MKEYLFKGKWRTTRQIAEFLGLKNTQAVRNRMKSGTIKVKDTRHPETYRERCERLAKEYGITHRAVEHRLRNKIPLDKPYRFNQNPGPRREELEAELRASIQNEWKEKAHSPARTLIQKQHNFALKKAIMKKHGVTQWWAEIAINSIQGSDAAHKFVTIPRPEGIEELVDEAA